MQFFPLIYQNVYQVTDIEQNVSDNREVNMSLKDCGCSVTLLYLRI